MANREELISTLEFLRTLDFEFEPADSDLLDRYAYGQGVAIVGLLKRGKSTLVNSMVGVPLSPIGREPETWCSIHVENGRWRAWGVGADGDETPLPADPEAFREAITRRGGVLPATATSARIICPNRLPVGLSLIDTPGLLELDLEEADLVWRQSRAAAGVLISSFPPGVSKDDRELYAKMKAHFGANLAVVIKGLDSEVGADELSQASEVWKRLGAAPLMIVESRNSSQEEWGSGPFAQLESAISTMAEAAQRDVEKLAPSIEKKLIRYIREHRIDVATMSRKAKLDLISRLRPSYEIPLVLAVRTWAQSLYVNLYDSIDFKDESFESLLDAAHCGSEHAQLAIRAVWEERISPNSRRVRAARLASSTGFIRMYEASLVGPSYSRFRPTECVELKLQDFIDLSSAKMLSADALRPIQSAVFRFINRISSAEECNALLLLPIPGDVQSLVISRLLSLVRADFGVLSLVSLKAAESSVMPIEWHDLSDQALRTLREQLNHVLQDAKQVCNVVRSMPPTEKSTFGGTISRSLVDGKAHHQFACVNSLLKLLVKTTRFATPGFLSDAKEVDDLVNAPRGLLAWVDFLKSAHLSQEPTRRPQVRRPTWLSVAFLASFVTLVSFGWGWASLGALAGTLFFARTGYVRENEVFATGIYTFDEFSSLVYLDQKSRDYRSADKKVSLSVISLIILGLLVGAVEHGSADLNDVSLELQETKSTPAYESSSETIVSTDSIWPPATDKDQPEAKVTSTDASLPTPQSVREVLAQLDGDCGAVTLRVEPGSDQLNVGSSIQSIEIEQQWSIRNGLAVVELSCGNSAALVSVKKGLEDLRVVDSFVHSADSVQRLSERLIRLGTNGATCCYPDLPFLTAEIVSIRSSGQFRRVESDIDRYPLWNASLDYCDRLASDDEFSPIRTDGTEFGFVEGYATVCVEGQLVSDLQEILVNEGFDLFVDGEFGPRTLRALRSFASRKGVADVDGVALVDGELYFARTGVRN